MQINNIGPIYSIIQYSSNIVNKDKNTLFELFFMAVQINNNRVKRTQQIQFPNLNWIVN